MRTGEGQRQREWLLGTGDSRGIALILVIAGLACAILALAAFLTPQYRLISTQYETTASKGDPGQTGSARFGNGGGPLPGR